MNAGTVVVVNITVDNGGLKKGLSDGKKAVQGFASDGEKSFDSLEKSSAVKSGLIAGAFTVAFQKVTSAVTGSIGDAIKRVDTLNNADRVFQNMGFTAEDTSSAMSALKSSILGLPTPLDSAVSGMQSLAASTGDLQLGQKVFKALNDAILGFGGDSAMVDNAVMQMGQAFSNGKIDGQTWVSMMNSGMGPALNAMAKQMGITTGELKSGLSEGKISVGEFQNALIGLDTEGGGGMESFEKIVKDSTSGIDTGMDNAKTAITRGVAGIIESIGSDNISKAVSGVGTAFETTLKVIGEGIQFVADHKDIFLPIAIAIGGVVTAMTLWTAVTKTATTAQKIMNMVVKAGWVYWLVMGIAAVVAVLVYLQAKFNIFGKLFEWIGGVAGAVWDGIKAGFAAVWGFIQPIINVFVVTFTTAFNIIKGVVMTLFNIFQFVFQLIWAIVSPFITTIISIFQTGWSIITSIINVLVGVFQFVFGLIWAVVEPVITAIGTAFSFVWDNVIKPVWEGVVGFFTGIWDGIKGAFSAVGKFFSDVFQGAVDKVKSIGQGIIDFFSGMGKKIGDFIAGGFKAVVNGALGLLEGFLNSPIKLINGAIDLINKIPGVDIKKITELKLPRMAMGGIVESPMAAIIGDAGREVVMPLENNTGWITELAQEIRERGGGGGGAMVEQNNIINNNVDMNIANRDLFRMARVQAV